MVRSNYHRHILYGESFADTIEKFEEMIKVDKNILATIDINQKKKGILSPAIRYLIQQYVDKNWEAFRQRQVQLKTKIMEKEA